MMGKLKKFRKMIADCLPKQDLHGFDYTVKELVGIRKNSEIAMKWHGKLLDNKILKYKTSDTIFILGSGPSINDISSKEWSHIKKHNSIGFNWWFVHDFVPTFYMFQGAYENMLETLKDQHYKYKNTPFLIRGSGFAKGEFNYNDERLNLLKNNPIYYVREYPIATKCSIDPFLMFDYLESLGLMDFDKISDFVPKLKCTLGLLIPLCYQMGYKKIILCGMDMQNNDHFWDYEPYDKLQNKYSLPKKGEGGINQLSKKIPEYIYAISDWVYKKNSVKILVMKEKTILYPKIKKYKL
jgi:hypothetical protein